MIMLLPACDYVAILNIENRMSTDVTILYYELWSDDTYPEPIESGTVPAGQTVSLPGPIINGIGGVSKFILEAKDPSGNIVWQKTWSGEEIAKEFGGHFTPKTTILNVVVSPYP
jgi:hypothetical protein